MLKNVSNLTFKMAEVIITYETLYELLRREKFKKELQKLDDSFFKDTIKYLNEKNSILDSQKSKSSIFPTEAKKTQIQLQNTIKILKELYERRESKIVGLALLSSRTKPSIQDMENMLKEEKEIYEALLNKLSYFRENILSNLLESKYPDLEKKPKDIKSENKETTLIRFLHPIPKFVGEDLEVYGPFEEHDVANLPQKIAQVLMDKNRVELIDSK